MNTVPSAFGLARHSSLIKYLGASPEPTRMELQAFAEYNLCKLKTVARHKHSSLFAGTSKAVKKFLKTLTPGRPVEIPRNKKLTELYFWI